MVTTEQTELITSTKHFSVTCYTQFKSNSNIHGIMERETLLAIYEYFKWYFFIEHTRELHIFILRRVKNPFKTPETHTYKNTPRF